MPDYLSDWRYITRCVEGSELKRSRILKKIDKFERDLRKVGGAIRDQRQFVEVLTTDRPAEFAEMMARFVFARLHRNDYSDWTGWEYRNEWATASYHPAVSHKRWRLEPAKSIAILGEQGIGDEIMFASCVADLKRHVQDVTVECDPRLLGVFERSLGVAVKPRSDIVSRASNKYLTEEREQDYFLPIGDLPRLFRKRLSDFPRQAYLRALPEKVEEWACFRGRVGIAWRSRTGAFAPSDLHVTDPVCLQYDSWEYETQGMTVPDCDLKDGIEDLLGICANLERVITPPQTIAHIAGSIGTKVDVIMPPVGSGRVENQLPYRYSDPMPWYPTVKVHRSLSEYLRRDI